MKDQIENKLNNEQIEELTAEIIQIKENTVINIMEIGKKLLQVKQSLKHGEFSTYLEEKVDFGTRTAQRYIKLYTEFSNTPTLADVEPSKLITLLDIKNKNDREEFLNNNDITNMSCRQISKAIKDMKNAHKNVTEEEKLDSNIIKPAKGETVTESISYNLDTKLNKISKNELQVADNEIDKIFIETLTMKNNIKLRTGSFYNDINSNLQLSDVESLLLTRYLNREITHSQFEQVIKQEKLNIPFMQNEEVYLKFLDDLDVSNSYNHLEYNNETKKYDRYYDILESHDLSYENVVLFAWETNENERQDYIENNPYCFSMDKITIASGWVETEEYICIYRDKKLFAHYDINSDYKFYITNLFKFYKINKKYLGLVDKFAEQKEKDRLEQLEEHYKNAVKDARFSFIKENETYLLSSYNTDQDYIRVFLEHEEIVYHILDKNVFSIGFYTDILAGTYKRELIKKAKDKKYSLVHIEAFNKALAAETKKRHDEYQKSYEQKYSNFNWDDFNFGFNDKKEPTLDIFSAEELQFLKDMLQDQDLWKKVYRKEAIKNHPDRAVIKGKDAVKKAENAMKLLNEINEKIIG